MFLMNEYKMIINTNCRFDHNEFDLVQVSYKEIILFIYSYVHFNVKVSWLIQQYISSILSPL